MTTTTRPDPDSRPNDRGPSTDSQGGAGGGSDEFEHVRLLATHLRDEGRLGLLRLRAELKERGLSLAVAGLAALAVVVAVPMAVGLVLLGIAGTAQLWMSPGLALLFAGFLALAAVALLFSILRRRVVRRFRADVGRAVAAVRRRVDPQTGGDERGAGAAGSARPTPQPAGAASHG